MRSDIRVVKVGGSLWDWPDLVPKLNEWLHQSTPGLYLLVVGGGSAVNSVRERQAAWHMSDDAAHWMALRVMSCHAHAAASLLNTSVPLESIAAIENAIQRVAAVTRPPERQLYVLSMEGILREHVRAVEPTWDVTSDSLAAWLARRIGAVELIVLKSGSPRVDAAHDRYFDPQFAKFMRGIPHVRVVNLRLSGWPSWHAHVLPDGTVACVPVAFNASRVRLRH